MPDWTTYQGITVPDATPTGIAGEHLKDNFVLLADRALTSICSGRLTLDEDEPLSTINQDAKTTLYFTPYKGNEISLYDTSDSIWKMHSFDQKSVLLTDNTQTGSTTNASAVVTGLTDTSQLIVGMEVTGTGIAPDSRISSIDSATQVTLDQNATATGSPSLTFKVPPYTLLDVFATFASDEVKLILNSANWTSSQATGAITGATDATPIQITSDSHGLSNGDLVGIEGVGGNTAPNGLVWTVENSAADTFNLQSSVGNDTYTSGGNWYKIPESRATNVATQDGVTIKSGAAGSRYLGTIMTTDVAGQCEDSVTKRFVWNENNRVGRKLLTPATDSAIWTYNSTTWRPANNQFSLRVCAVVGRAVSELDLTLHTMDDETTSSSASVSSIGENSTDSSGADLWTNAINGLNYTVVAALVDYPAVGYHFYPWIEKVTAASHIGTFHGDVTDNRELGLIGSVQA